MIHSRWAKNIFVWSGFSAVTVVTAVTIVTAVTVAALAALAVVSAGSAGRSNLYNAGLEQRDAGEPLAPQQSHLFPAKLPIWDEGYVQWILRRLLHEPR